MLLSNRNRATVQWIEYDSNISLDLCQSLTYTNHTCWSVLHKRRQCIDDADDDTDLSCKTTAAAAAGRSDDDAPLITWRIQLRRVPQMGGRLHRTFNYDCAERWAHNWRWPRSGRQARRVCSRVFECVHKRGHLGRNETTATIATRRRVM